MKPDKPQPSADTETPGSPRRALTPALPAEPPIWHSRTLLGAGALAYITHQGETYRLQLTRQGKLILTK